MSHNCSRFHAQVQTESVCNRTSTLMTMLQGSFREAMSCMATSAKWLIDKRVFATAIHISCRRGYLFSMRMSRRTSVF